MNKKWIGYVFFLVSTLFGFLPSVFADSDFEIVVTNESDVAYNVDVVLTAVGFDAMYGWLRLGYVSSNETKQFPYAYKYMKVPLTGTGMPSSLDECNLAIEVTAGRENSFKSLKYKSNEVVRNPQLIQVEKDGRIMEGIRPPKVIKILIVKEESGKDKLRVKFIEK